MAHPFALRLPYVAKLDTTINPGQSLIVRGQPKKGGDRFDINFATGPDTHTDLVFHVSCRFKDKTYVFNTKENGSWGKEEREKCHLDPATPFNIRIRCHESKFEIFVDGKELYEYKYRAPLHGVTHMIIDGDLTLNAVGWEGNYYAVPYKAVIPGHFQRGRKLLLTLIPQDGDCFAINFQNGEDIAFHFNPRFNKKHTVNNNCIAGKWGAEEVVKGFPFEKKKSMDLLFFCENDCIGVYVNGESYCMFAHRTDPNLIDNLTITGHVELQVVNFE